MATMIRSCTCVHTYQDKTYGNGQRVHNVFIKSNKDGHKMRCTVCGRGKP